jgi:hypothetical protein
LSRGSRLLSYSLVLSIFLYSFCSDLLTPDAAFARGQPGWATVRISEPQGCPRIAEVRIPVGLMDFLARHSQSEPIFVVDGEILDARDAWRKVRQLQPGHKVRFQVDEGSIEVELN